MSEPIKTGIEPVNAAGGKAQAVRGFHQAWTPKLRETALKALTDYQPKNADPVCVAIVKDAAQKMIAALPPEVNGVEMKVECCGVIGRQVLVQVTPHNL
jgi:hypothetical protein